MFDTAGLGAALTSAKVILELVRNANDAQLAMKISAEIANLQGKLIEVQQHVLSMQTENFELQDQVRSLKQAFDEEQSFAFLHGVYWKTRLGPGQEKLDGEGNLATFRETLWDGPFCPLCKDVDGKTVRLRDSRGFQNSKDRSWYCDVHETDYRAPTMKP